MNINAELGEHRPVVDVKQLILGEFTGENARLAQPINVLNRIRREPLFVVAGVQLLDDVLYNETDMPECREILFQPVIRLKFIDEVDLQKPTTTSFINVASLRI